MVDTEQWRDVWWIQSTLNEADERVGRSGGKGRHLGVDAHGFAAHDVLGASQCESTPVGLAGLVVHLRLVVAQRRELGREGRVCPLSCGQAVKNFPEWLIARIWLRADQSHGVVVCRVLQRCWRQKYYVFAYCYAHIKSIFTNASVIPNSQCLAVYLVQSSIIAQIQ